MLENLEPQPRGAEVTAGTTKHEHVCRYRYANPPARVCTNQITSANIQNPRACTGSEALLNILFLPSLVQIHRCNYPACRSALNFYKCAVIVLCSYWLVPAAVGVRRVHCCGRASDSVCVMCGNILVVMIKTTRGRLDRRQNDRQTL